MCRTSSKDRTLRPARLALGSRKLGLSALALLSGMLLLAIGCNGRPDVDAQAGKPLLQSGDHVFDDPQVGLKFEPPLNWSMQSRTTEAPGLGPTERLVVKYKRLIAGLDPAWLKVYVSDLPEDVTLDSCVQRRRPKPEWNDAGALEDVTVGGIAGRRGAFTGQYEGRASTCEVVCVRRGGRVFSFVGMFVTADPKGRKRIRTAIETVKWAGNEPQLTGL